MSIGLYGIGTNIQDKLDAVHKICTQYPFILICADLAGLYVGDNDYETEPVSLPHYMIQRHLKTYFLE